HVARIPAWAFCFAFASPWKLILRQDSDDRCGHEVGHGSREHGADTQTSQIAAAVRRKGADSADLNSNGAEVREPAQRKRGDGERPRIDRSLVRTQLLKCHDFVYHHASSQKIS